MAETDNISIRSAGPGDVQAIHAMIMALADATGDELEVKSSPQDFLSFGFSGDPLFEAMLAERDGDAVGLCLFFHSFSSWLGEPGIYVQDLYVADRERGRGLGRKLLSAVAAKGLIREASYLRLSVRTWNSSARDFYARIGMQHRDKEEIYHLGGEGFLALADSGG